MADSHSVSWWSAARRALNLENDALAAHRDGIRLRFSWLAALALLPFTLLHLFTGNWPMFALNAIISSAMAANALALQRGRTPLLPFWVLCVLMIAGIVGSVRLQGSFGVFWAYPALFMFFFVLTRRQAMALALLMLGVVTATATVSMGVPLAARVLMSLGFTLVSIQVVLNVVGELQAALVNQAITDPLTGAFNRRHLDAQIGARGDAAPVDGARDVLLLIDVDHFKCINDEHGHDVGDAVLRALVAAIQGRKRSGDTLFRAGGEEFVLLLPSATQDAARRVAEDLRQRVAEAPLLPGQRVTVSIGLSALAPGQTPEAWLKAADTAPYRAKREGRNRIAEASLG